MWAFASRDGPAGEDNPGMAHSGGTPQGDRALATVVETINDLTEIQDDGPGVVLTLGGLLVSGTVIPDWQWFDEVEHAARAAFVVHTGGSIDDEHGGWAGLFEGIAESLAKARDEHRKARQAAAHLAERYRHLLARDSPTTYIHLREARVIAAGASPLPAAGMYWRGRISEISGWSFGHLGAGPPAAAGQSNP
jgi:hypothetical protein